ncbi:related to CDP diacylglycerol-inositol 3-phosphatidyltransferase [Phialocephala subalpina]|uniref:CDP-diacylglycerol--inositol 3-phosphatidyltransferase n=1 Tax=Phialocephala subalpina TaxID=576137 RepID=A0A1L7WU03_9HELO|nr:related to CDP diacylglycerol-inositol 3-phosphatidyltransferase [Phialocephala subalpina]
MSTSRTRRHTAVGSNAPISPVLETRDQPRSENVFLFWPSIIGYIRIVLAITSLYYMPVHPRRCSALYSLSCLLDAVDGFLARYLDQASYFGAVLDMVTDRCTTACLLVFLSSAWPRWSIVFQGLICLDFASHYVHMCTSLILGGERSHKMVDEERSWLLNLYYSNKIVSFLLCFFNELFFIALYLLAFTSPPGDSEIEVVVANSPHGAGAFEIARANKLDPAWPLFLARISFLGMLIKQLINVLQFVKASTWLAESDVEMRRKRRSKSENVRGKANKG